MDTSIVPYPQATQDGTNVGLKAAGVDVCLSDVGEAIEEAITAYEFDPMNGGKVGDIYVYR